MSTTILGAMSAADFLAEYWQKQPLLLRGVANGQYLPLDGDELAGLACEPEVESRIVMTHPGPRWELRRGPFDADAFAALGDRGWTLLVQDVDKLLPEFADFLDLFSFIPAWRIDDLMVSWAADGGSVGPHIDAYDVFLVQTTGQRRWRVGSAGDSQRLRGDHELAVLEEFTARDEWVLDPGDVLYLPPGIPHWGIAEDGPCMTWSVGFRAPSRMELLADFADRIAAAGNESQRYTDADLGVDEAATGMLTPQAIARALREFDAACVEARAGMAQWLGESLTSPKPWLRCEPAANPVTLTGARTHIYNAAWTRDPRARLLWLEDTGGESLLCVDGESWRVPGVPRELLQALCTERRFPPGGLARYGDNDAVMEVLARLIAGGQWVIDDDS